MYSKDHTSQPSKKEKNSQLGLTFNAVCFINKIKEMNSMIISVDAEKAVHKFIILEFQKR